MNPNFIPRVMTDEDRAQAAIKRESKKQYAEQNLKTVYADEKYWTQLSSDLGVRLPQWYHAGVEIKYLRRTAKKLGYDIAEFLQETGFSSLKAFAECNSTWNARALCGLMMETFVNRDEKVYYKEVSGA